MKKNRIITHFSDYRQAELGNLAGVILVAMTGNEYFPDPFPSLATLQAATDAYNEALRIAAMGTAKVTTVKGNRREALEDVLRTLAFYVMSRAGGDKVILQSSGFPLASERGGRRKAIPVSKPTGVTAKTHDTREFVEISLDEMPGARVYVFQYAKAPLASDSDWITVHATGPVYGFTGLVTAQEYVFRVGVVGAGGELIYSDIISSYVL